MTQKYPDPIDGYDFIIGNGGSPRYRFNKKMVAGAKVPQDIKDQLHAAYEELKAAHKKENDVQTVSVEEINARVAPNYEDIHIEDDIPSDVDVEGLKQQLIEAEKVIESLISESINGASLNDLADHLFTRFNVYTAFCGQEPTTQNIHPITAEIMTSFDQGLARKQYLGAKYGGHIESIEKTIVRSLQNPRHDNPNAPEPQVHMGNNFQPLQSHMEEPDLDMKEHGLSGVIGTPPLRQKIVDPSWASKSRHIDTFDFERQ